MSENYTVTRSTVVAASPDRIYPHLSDFHKWTAWSPWEGLDPDVRRTYGGPEQGTGATYAWAGNRKVGEGRMEITEADPESRLVIALDFIKPFKSSSTTVFDLAPEGDSTKVTWTMTGPMTLMTKLVGLFRPMDKMVGPDFEKGLGRLKTVVEQPSN